MESKLPNQPSSSNTAMEPKLPNQGSSSSTALEPKLPNQGSLSMEPKLLNEGSLSMEPKLLNEGSSSNPAMEPKLANQGSSSNTAMELKFPNQDILQRFVYAYLIKNGYQRTAEVFRNDTQITEPMLDESPAFWSDFLDSFYEVYNSRASKRIQQTSTQDQVLVHQPSNTSTQDDQVLVHQPSNTSTPDQVLVQQPLNIGPVINTDSALIIPLQHHSSFGSRATLLSCDISSDGKIVASGGFGKKPFICYTETGISATTQETHKHSILEVRFKPDCNLFATASIDTTVKLWDATTPATVLRHMEYPTLTHTRSVRSLDFHPFDNKTLCSSDDALIKVWDLNQQIRVNSFKEGGRVVRFQPVDGRLLAVANGKCITIFEYPDLVVVKKLEGHVKAIKSICWDVTGEMIASVSEDEVRVWSASQLGECIHNCSYNGKKFKSVIFHPRYDKALVIGGHECLLLLNLEDMKEYPTDVSEIYITGLAATRAQSQFIASASEDCLVKIWK